MGDQFSVCRYQGRRRRKGDQYDVFNIQHLVCLVSTMYSGAFKDTMRFSGSASS